MVRKLLRSAGLALILLPEPFTTPLGLALLSASYIFAHFRRIDTPSYLRGLIKLYLKEARLRGGSPGVIQHKLKQTLSDSEWRYRPARDVQCGIDAGRLMLRFGKDMTIEFAEPATPIRHSMKHDLYGYVMPSVPVHTETAVIHTVDSERLLRHYEKTMPARSAVTPEPIVHAFNPAKASLALGMG